ncbi:uncharacterized protein LOC107322827 isoform X2 [Coturnix japonica]|uniref:uncharacterized protein LOC107322827 isoform X2 n=1 Tax=Coturnix japonica TaxID=93934 RepID=UPI0007772C5D|nr:uncharacterized protein LOC107322827 isoform X2 [Coturnix japonica]
MECCCSAGFRNPDEFLSRAGKSGKLRPRGQEVGAGGSWLLDLPLGVKIPVQPGTKLLFARRKLGEKLHQPSPQFDLGDPYSRNLRTEYNSLHDPHLRGYYDHKANLRNLKNRGLVTKDGRVVCTLKEFNEYRQYLTRLKMEHENIKRREEELQGCSKNTGRAMKVPVKLPKLETGSRGAKLPQSVCADAASTGKLRFPGGHEFRAMSQHREDQRLQEVDGTQEKEALEEVKALDPSADALRRASIRIRQRLLGSTERAEPSEMSPSSPELDAAQQARELVANVLQNAMNSLKSS